MKRICRRIGSPVLLIAALGLIAWTAPAQEKVTPELAGDYRLDLGDRTLPFKIILVEAKLFFNAQVPGQAAQPMTPVEGKELTFTSRDPNGDDVTLVFMKDDMGKITGCTVTLPARGAEARAVKVEIK